MCCAEVLTSAFPTDRIQATDHTRQRLSAELNTFYGTFFNKFRLVGFIIDAESETRNQCSCRALRSHDSVGSGDATHIFSSMPIAHKAVLASKYRLDRFQDHIRRISIEYITCSLPNRHRISFLDEITIFHPRYASRRANAYYPPNAFSE